MSSIIQPRLLRRMTVRRVLDLLRENGPSSRADLTRCSGISAPTVSKAVTTLLEQGLVEEGPATQGSLGRPGTVLRLARDRAQVLGVVLDKDQCSLTSAGLDGEPRTKQHRCFTTPETYEGLIERLADEVQTFTQRSKVRTLGVGLSIPGLINRREQRAVLSPNLHVTDGHRPDEDLSRRLNIDCVMYQETHVLCLAERFYHASEPLDDFAMLEIGTGLGLGVFTGGRLLEGHSGLAGELGHITVVPNGRLCGCGNRGCLETMATDRALTQMVSERLKRMVDLEAVQELLESEDELTNQDFNTVCEYVSIAMSAAINLFNPATLFVHGRLFDVRPGVFERVCELAQKRSLGPSSADCRIRRARGSKAEGAIAAAIQLVMSAHGPVFEP